MNRKLIACALALLVLAFCLVSCGKKDGFQKDATQKYEPIEFTTNAQGEKFVTNVNGDLIPVTTGKDGSMELVDDLYTKTKEQAESEKEEIRKEEEKHAGTSGQNSQDNTRPNRNPTQPTNPSGGVEIGNQTPDSVGKEAVVVW